MPPVILLLLVLIRGADCQPLAQPKKLPALDAVLDSAGLLSRIRATDSAASELLVSVFLAAPPDGSVLEGSAPAASAQRALREVLASLREPSKAAPAGFRVRVRFGPAPTLGLERSVLCAPQALETGGNAGDPVMVRRVESGSRPASERGRQITPTYRIDALGRVLSVDLGSGTGVPELDRAIREAAVARRYRPATLDGRAVEVKLSGTRVELIP